MAAETCERDEATVDDGLKLGALRERNDGHQQEREQEQRQYGHLEETPPQVLLG